MPVPKGKTDKQLRAIGARIAKARTADDFANAVVDVLGFGKGSVQWVEARAIWALIDSGQMSKEQALQAIAARLGEHVKAATESMKAAKKHLTNS